VIWDTHVCDRSSPESPAQQNEDDQHDDRKQNRPDHSVLKMISGDDHPESVVLRNFANDECCNREQNSISRHSAQAGCRQFVRADLF
jgi:hypothetical protein